MTNITHQLGLLNGLLSDTHELLDQISGEKIAAVDMKNQCSIIAGWIAGAQRQMPEIIKELEENFGDSH